MSADPSHAYNQRSPYKQDFRKKDVLYNTMRCFFVKFVVSWLMLDIITKEQFLAEHNRLSPNNLQATFALLTQFQEQRKLLLTDTRWSFKLRIPFIIWLDSLPPAKKKYARAPKKQVFKNYPETH